MKDFVSVSAFGAVITSWMSPAAVGGPVGVRPEVTGWTPALSSTTVVGMAMVLPLMTQWYVSVVAPVTVMSAETLTAGLDPSAQVS